MAGRIASIDFGTFLVFVIAVIVWLGLGSWGASMLTRKNYLAPDSPQTARHSDVVRRMGPASVSPQMVLAVTGPIVLIIALVLPKRS
jgi:hypothetical protein